jgi:hypothetical protein
MDPRESFLAKKIIHRQEKFPGSGNTITWRKQRTANKTKCNGGCGVDKKATFKGSFALRLVHECRRQGFIKDNVTNEIPQDSFISLHFRIGTSFSGQILSTDLRV